MRETLTTPFDDAHPFGKLRMTLSVAEGSGCREQCRGAKLTKTFFVFFVFFWPFFLTTAPTSTSLSAEPLIGRVDVRVKPGATAAPAVVYVEPLDGAAPMRPTSVSVAQKNKAFAPRVLGVPLGSTVEFPNGDGIFHNVFSLSSPQPFDLGLYRSGASKSRTFSKPAIYHVFCNIHPQMAAFIVVAPSPWVTTVSPDGAWRLDVPPGRYRVTALSERAPPVSLEVRVGQAGTDAVVTLDESVFVPGQHMNKFGKPYPKEAYKESR